jgi:hypothetical protein
LYLWVKIAVSSYVEMWCCVGLVSGVYVSGMMSSSKNISLLYSVNLSISTSIGLVSYCFSMLQNYLGLYFNISGSSNCIFALCLLQLSLNNV